MINKVNILGKEYTVEVVEKPSDVDINKQDSLWGQVDYWTRTIRVYKAVNINDQLHVLLHEMVHAIVEELHIDSISRAKDYENIVDLLALGLMDTLTRNGWLKEEVTK